jgi:hypothetical protein
MHDEIRTGRPPLDDLDTKILAILDKSQFELAHSISITETLLVAHLIMLWHVQDSIGFKSFHLHWVPHILTDDLPEKRKEHARPMLSFLHIAERDGWHHLVTADESWFFFNTLPCHMWTLSRNDVITKPRLDVQSKKFMFTIIWNPSGFYVINILPNDTKMNSAYFVTNIFIPFIPLEQAIFHRGRALHQKRLVVHLDNCSIHTSRT